MESLNLSPQDITGKLDMVDPAVGNLSTEDTEAASSPWLRLASSTGELQAKVRDHVPEKKMNGSQGRHTGLLGFWGLYSDLSAFKGFI